MTHVPTTLTDAAIAVRSKNTHWVMRDIVRRHWLAVGTEHGVVAPDGRCAEVVLDNIVHRLRKLCA